VNLPGRLVTQVLLAALVGCGRARYLAAEDSGARDVGPLDTPATDTPPDVPRPMGCAWDAPVFDAPTLVLPSIVDPVALSLSADALTLYFGRAGVVFSSTRASLTAPFGTPSRLDEVFDAGFDVDGVVFRRDGLELVMSSGSLGGLGGHDLFRRVRSSRADSWSAPEALTRLNSAQNDWDYFLTADGLTLWFQRQTMEPSTGDIYRARRGNLSSLFDPGIAVPSLSVPGLQETGPSLPDDGSVVVMSVGPELNIHYAPITGTLVGAPTPLPELNSPMVEYEVTIRGDGCEIFFVSNRGGSMQIYGASRTR
jgi:hypothetical protein